ncbi:hypothetical protein Tco_1373279 [Tanacetum coccineum]
MVPNTEKLLEAFIGGLPRSIKGNVTASKPQTLEEAINIAQRLMDQVTKHTPVQVSSDHKRKFEDRRTFNNNNNYRRNKHKEVEVEEHHRNLLLSKNKKHMSSECKHVKLDTWNDQSEVICAMCKQCLITANHDVCMLNYVNDMNSRGRKQKANSPKPNKPRFCLRWSPTGRFFDIKGKIIASSESESQSDCSNGDNACTSNPSEPKINTKSKISKIQKESSLTCLSTFDNICAPRNVD